VRADGVAAGDVVDADKIKIAAQGKIGHVAVEQHHGDAGLAEFSGDLRIEFHTFFGVFKRGEDHAIDLAGDELIGQQQGLLGGIIVGGGAGGVAMNQKMAARLGMAGDFGADRIENFGIAQTRDNQAEIQRARTGRAADSCGCRCLSRGGAR